MILSSIQKISEFNRKIQYWILRCDQCQNNFEKRKRGFKPEKAQHHFCSRKCYKKAISSGGILDYIARMLAIRNGIHPFEDPEVLQKRTQTWIKNYGVDHPWKSSDVREKNKQTWLKKYGYDNPASSPQIKKKIDQAALHLKGHQTRKREGTYTRSKIENNFYKTLCNIFSQNDIERQVIINGWSIDFYIKSIDVFVQFDGVYWHGLNRPIEVIKEFKKSRDKTIFGTWLRDIKQNEWFTQQKMTLVRITDKTYKSFLKKNERN